MTSAIKVSSCVDCGMPMIGDLSRCSACRAAALRQTSPLARLAVALEVLGIVVFAIVLLVKGCLP